MANGKPLLPEWVFIAVIGVALSMWVLSVGYSAINPKWEVPAAVHGGASAVILGVMGLLAVSRAKTNGG